MGDNKDCLSCRPAIEIECIKGDLETLKSDIKGIQVKMAEIEIENAKKDVVLENINKLLVEIKEDLKSIKSAPMKFTGGIVSGATIAIIANIILKIFFKL